MKYYPTKIGKRKLPLGFAGILLTVLSVPGILYAAKIEDDGPRILGILGFLVLFWVGIAFVFMGFLRFKTDLLHSFAVSADGKLYHVHATEMFMKAPRSIITRIMKAKEIEETAAYNTTMYEILESGEMTALIEKIIGDPQAFDNYIAVKQMDNPAIIKTDRKKATIYYTYGSHLLIQSAALLKSNTGYGQILEYVQNARKDVIYTGKKPGDFLIA